MATLAPVAQLDRAPAFGAGCRGFESLQARFLLGNPKGLPNKKRI